MRWRQSFATILVGKNILLREGIAKILRAEHFHILASVSSVDDFLEHASTLSCCFSLSRPEMISISR